MPINIPLPPKLFANKQGNIAINFCANPEDSSKTDLTLSWSDTTTLQEGTHSFSVTLDKSIDELPIAAAFAITGSTDFNYAIDDPDGESARRSGAQGTFTNTRAGAQTLTIRFMGRDASGQLTEQPAAMEAIEYSKASYAHALEYTEEWRATWLRALALAWSNPDLATALKADPYSFLQEHCNYELPPTVELVVVDDPDTGGFQGASRTPYDWTWKLPRSILVMFIPPAPPAAEQAIAIAAYEAVGKQYPMTMTS